ncbi:MAG: hypothetical protein AAFX52_07340 [Pseudomonadota bacterium]
MGVDAVSFLASALMQAANPSPCTDESYSDFDFWVGTWDVYVGDSLAGRNVITKEETGCLVLETWNSASGGTGQSYNYFDPAQDVWRQVWISPGLLIDYQGGIDEEGRMALEGTLTSHASGTTAPFRGRWESLDDGTVQQTFWIYKTDDDAWTVWFDGNYQPADDEE